MSRAIVLEHGNPSMKSQMKALAAAEGKFLLICFTIFLFQVCCWLPLADM